MNSSFVRREESGSLSEDEMDSFENGGSKDNRRAHHNALERKRRDHIKESFLILRDQIPSIAGEKSSRATILNTAREYIQQMRESSSVVEIEVDELKKQNEILSEQIRILENQLNSTSTFNKIE